MSDFPYIEVSFVIEGKYFDVQQFTKEIGIVPSETRGIDDWPNMIKNNLNIPEDLQPRYVWCICQKEELCKKIEFPINKIISQLTGKEQKFIEFCEKNNLQKVLNIAIHGDEMNLPEIVLSPSIVSYFGNMKVEIGFDIYVY